MNHNLLIECIIANAKRLLMLQSWIIYKNKSYFKLSKGESRYSIINLKKLLKLYLNLECIVYGNDSYSTWKSKYLIANVKKLHLNFVKMNQFFMLLDLINKFSFLTRKDQSENLTYSIFSEIN